MDRSRGDGGVGDEDEDRPKDESAALFNETFAASTQGATWYRFRYSTSVVQDFDLSPRTAVYIVHIRTTVWVQTYNQAENPCPATSCRLNRMG